MDSVRFLHSIVFCLGLVNVLQAKSSYYGPNVNSSQGSNFTRGTPQLNSQVPGRIKLHISSCPAERSCPGRRGSSQNEPTGMNSVKDPRFPESYCLLGTAQTKQQTPGTRKVESAGAFNQKSVRFSSVSRPKRQIGTGSSGAMASSFSNGMGMRYPMMGMGMYPGMWG